MPDYLLGLIVGMGIGIVATLIGVCVEGYLHKRAVAGVQEVPRG